jgi:2-keto-4-pentenoate hydratase
MAGDIVDVTAACLLNPAAGVAAVIRKVAQKAKKDASS